LWKNTTGYDNVALGFEAMKDCTEGYGNVAIGRTALENITTGDYNTALGRGALNATTSGNNNIAIGLNSTAPAASTSNSITLGNTDNDNLRCQDTSISSISDERDKTNIVNIPLGLAFLNTVRPVSFDWAARDGSKIGKKDFGFIAQELKVAADATDYADHMRLVHNENPDLLEADPMKMFPILVKAIQELSAKNEALLTRIEALEG